MPTVATASSISTTASMALMMMTSTAPNLVTDESPVLSSSLGRVADESLFEMITNPSVSNYLPQNDHLHLAYETTTIASKMFNNLLESNNMDVMSQLDATVSVSSIYSIDGISRWATTDCTALVHALLASFSVILVSELGDKTFIITAIMAMKNSRSLVFIASAMALLTMTILSVGMGVAVTVIPKLYTHYVSIILFLCFGLKMLKEAYDMNSNGEDESEFDEVKRSLEANNCENIIKESQKPPASNDEIQYTQTESLTKTIGDGKQLSQFVGSSGQLDSAYKLPADNRPISESSSGLNRTLDIAPVIIKVFTMVFIAEWGDRSQISTVILAAREDVAGVFIGSLSGHVLCTGLAVIGGRYVAEMISVRTMTLIGGIIFLFFATFAIITGPET